MRTIGIGARTEENPVLAELEAENEMIKKTNREARDRISDLETMLEESREEAAGLQRQLEESREEITGLQKQLEESQQAKSGKDKAAGK